MNCRLRCASPRRSLGLFLALVCLLIAASGCGDDAKHVLTPPAAPDYLANDSPDNLIANVVMAWEAEDAAGYAALLYDGVELATDGLTYASFKFYFDRSIDPQLPELYAYSDELACVEAMLGGEPGDGVPGIKSVAMNMAANGAWQSIAGGDVDGDSFPEDALWRSYNTDMLFTLKTNVGGSDINQWQVSDRALFYCLPVQVGEATEWRLWKWRDVINLRTEDATFGQIKALYGQ